MSIRYVEARRLELIELKQGDRTVAEYEAEFMRLSHYAQGMVATEQEKCVRFENGWVLTSKYRFLHIKKRCLRL